MEELKLIEPSMDYDAEVMAYRQEFLDDGSSMDGCGPLRRFESTREWLDWIEAMKHEETTPPDKVPMASFICVRESDNTVVGMVQIRKRMNEYIEKYAGHIGYSVRPGERRKGYATWMLGAALRECAQLGIHRALVCCRPENEGSRRTILNNGGVYESTVYVPDRETYLERYWIDC